MSNIGKKVEITVGGRCKVATVISEMTWHDKPEWLVEYVTARLERKTKIIPAR